MKTATPHTHDMKSSMRNPFGIALVAYYLIMAVVGMLIPDDILSNNVWAREFSDFMAGIVPQIDRITALNIKPDVNRFYFSVLWAGSPVLVGMVFIGAVVHGINTNYINNDMSFIRLGVVAIVGTAMSCTVMLFPFAEASPRLVNSLIGIFVNRGLFAQIIFVNGPVIFITAVWLNLPYFLITGKYRSAITSMLQEKGQASDSNVGS